MNAQAPATAIAINGTVSPTSSPRAE